MASELTSPVPLSTPDDHILAEVDHVSPQVLSSRHLSDEDFSLQYETERTLTEIRRHRWHRIALQFPDEMLGDSARVYQLLARGYRTQPLHTSDQKDSAPAHDRHNNLEREVDDLSLNQESTLTATPTLKLTILADTSYGSCCVDEVAAEHVEADVVVHYGRSCLSATSRLPVLYVYTERPLHHEAVLGAFKQAYSDKSTKVICMADVPYSRHVYDICQKLKTEEGYENVFATEVLGNNASLIPNRTLPGDVQTDGQNEAAAKQALTEWSIFHISEPPTALLLTLQSRVHSVHIYPTTNDNQSGTAATYANTAQVLRRRYALVTSLSTVAVWGILINTLSVKNYLHMVDHVKRQIADAGKKSYLFVVGKLNPAKVANFAEIGGWVVIGCWESSLIDSRDFYRPIITPFELELVLKTDDERVWTGEWRSDFQKVLDQAENRQDSNKTQVHTAAMPGAFVEDDSEDDLRSLGSDDESAPPEFDLRTGKYVSRTRPLQRRSIGQARTARHSVNASTALTKRVGGEISKSGNVNSPAAEFLASNRTWRGLGSDFEIKYEDDDEQGGLVEEGLTGVASAYTTSDLHRA